MTIPIRKMALVLGLSAALLDALMMLAVLIGTALPRGDMLAFASETHGNREIELMDIGRELMVNISRNAVWDDSPAWSPDGEQIAFMSTRDQTYGIYIMDANGRNVRRLTAPWRNGYSPAWSPDGQRIAFMSTQGRGAQIFVMSAVGSGEDNG